MTARHLLPRTSEAVQLLGSRVRVARQERGWTITELAERLGASHVTVRRIERGDPTVAIGTAFEAAALVGVPLFHADPERRRLERARVDDRLAVLPKAVRLPTIDDDF